MTDHRSPVDAALDLVLYAPVGLALALTEEVPKLAARGRAGLGAQVRTARVVGQFAVTQGRRELTRRLRTSPAAAPFPVGTATPASAAREPAAGHPTGSRPPGPPPPVAGLPIADYDSLSASQVVQRLAGLSGPELQALREYESAGRGRRTILARVGQLQGR